MDYEKAYKEALEKIREGLQPLQDGTKISGVTRAFLEEVFPELKESEDERIRKMIINHLTQERGSLSNDEAAEAIAWLEKQGEQKTTDKVELKFHEGDWIVCKGLNTAKIISFDDDRYEVEFIDGSKGFPHIDYVDRNFHLWTIEDAKDGDVLVDVYGTIGIFQKNDDFDWSSYCSLGSNGGFRCFAIEHELDRSHPATKEQRDLLFQKIKEAGYQWDAEKKELKLLISNGGDFESNNSKQKSTWSDEDDAYKLFAISAVEDYYDEKNPLQKVLIEWLKSLKERLS